MILTAMFVSLMAATGVMANTITIEFVSVGPDLGGGEYEWKYNVKLTSNSKLDESSPFSTKQGVVLFDINDMVAGTALFTNANFATSETAQTSFATGDPQVVTLNGDVNTLLNINLAYTSASITSGPQTLGTLTFHALTNKGSDQFKVSSHDLAPTGQGGAFQTQFAQNSAFMPDANGVLPVPLPPVALAGGGLFWLIGALRVKKMAVA